MYKFVALGALSLLLIGIGLVKIISFENNIKNSQVKYKNTVTDTASNSLINNNTFANLINKQKSDAAPKTTLPTPTLVPTIKVTPTIQPTIEQPEQFEDSHGYQQSPNYVNVRTNYTLYSKDRNSLCNEINVESRKMSSGYIEMGNISYKVSYSLSGIHTSKGYSVGNYSVDVDSTITTPAWAYIAGASDDLKNDFNTLKNEVVDHENDHLEILKSYTQKIVDDINNLGYYPSQQEVSSLIKSAYDKHMAEMSKAQDAYDANPKHRIRLDKFCTNDF